MNVAFANFWNILPDNYSYKDALDRESKTENVFSWRAKKKKSIHSSLWIASTKHLFFRNANFNGRFCGK